MWHDRQRYTYDVNVQDWSQWPYVNQTGYPNIAAHWPYGYPTLGQTQAYQVYGPPPRPRRVNHLMHAIATFFTLACWIPVWFVVTIVTHNRNTRADVEYWSKIQRYRQWELSQQRHALEQSG